MQSNQPIGPIDFGGLSEWAPELAEMLVSVATDIALVVDASGIIRRVALSGNETVKAISGQWVGLHWTDTATSDTRQKVEQLLADVASRGVSRVRHINHPSQLGQDVAIAYSAISLGKAGPVLVVGRDMSVVSAMQQRLVSAQQEMERDYWQQRQSEARYQLLFQIATDPALVVDASSLRIIDANRAAMTLFGLSLDQLLGSKAMCGIDEVSRPAVELLLTSARVQGHFVEEEAELLDRRGRVRISATPFHAESTTVLLMRMLPLDAQWRARKTENGLAHFIGETPDAIVIADDQGRVQMANPAFLMLVQLPGDDMAVGCPLSNWLDDLSGLLTQVRAHGRLMVSNATLRPTPTQVVAVDLSAVLLAGDGRESFGFIMRVSDRVADDRSVPWHPPVH